MELGRHSWILRKDCVSEDGLHCINGIVELSEDKEVKRGCKQTAQGFEVSWMLL